MRTNIKKNVLEEIGYISDTIPSNVYEDLLIASDVDNNTTKRKYSDRLAGQIEEQYYIFFPILMYFLFKPIVLLGCHEWCIKH